MFLLYHLFVKTGYVNIIYFFFLFNYQYQIVETGYEGEVDGEIIEVSGEKRLIPSALLDNLRYNVKLNFDEDLVRVRHLDWYDYVNKNKDDGISEDEKYDLIIGSDLINWEDDIGKIEFQPLK